MLDSSLKPKDLSRVTIADVAEQAGVSIATVSRVLNHTAPVATETAAQVQSVIDDLGYTPSAAARNLASRKTYTLGLLLPDISSDFFPPLLRGIEAGARENDYGLLISTQKICKPSTGFNRPLGEHNTDGMLIFTDSLNNDEMARLHGLGFPMVLLYQSPPNDLNIPGVAFENKSGSRKLIDHLVEIHGYRRIAFLKGPEDNEDSFWREIGYREALEAHGIPFDPQLVAVGGFNEKGARTPVENWLRESIGIDAIFAGDDNTASGVIATLKTADKRVPEDIAVVGFDDILTSRYLTPPLTTVRAPIETAGYEAVQKLIRLIQKETVETLTLLPTELVIRWSCGCNKRDD